MKPTTPLVGALAGFPLFVAIPTLVGGTATRVLRPVQVLAPSDAALGYGEDFGASVAISGDWLVVGAPRDDELEGDAGAAYVFRRQGARWIEHQKLHGLPLFGETFGASVGISGDWIVVGAPAAYDIGAGTGRAQVYRRDDRGTPSDLSDDLWNVAAFLNPPPSHLCCGFGAPVRIDDGVIVSGSAQGEFEPGRAYIFQWDGVEWIGPQTIVPSDSEPGDLFGDGVAVSGNLVAVAASGDRYACPKYAECRGSAYVFRRDGGTWAQEAKLIGNAVRGIGSAIGASDDMVAVARSGSVHVFQQGPTGWVEWAVLSPPDAVAHRFGAYHLAMKGDRVLVGASDHMWGYLFENKDGVWTEIAKLQGPLGFHVPRVAIDSRFGLVHGYVYALGESFSLTDYAAFQNCYAREAVMPGCQHFDLEPDGSVDTRDLPLFLLTFRGPE